LTVFDYGEADGQAYIAYRHMSSKSCWGGQCRLKKSCGCCRRSGNSVERDSSQESLTVDATLQAKTLFDYRVTALDAAGNILARSDPQFFRTP
jgi:hypothetical protein